MTTKPTSQGSDLNRDATTCPWTNVPAGWEDIVTGSGGVTGIFPFYGDCYDAIAANKVIVMHTEEECCCRKAQLYDRPGQARFYYAGMRPSHPATPNYPYGYSVKIKEPTCCCGDDAMCGTTSHPLPGGIDNSPYQGRWYGGPLRKPGGFEYCYAPGKGSWACDDTVPGYTGSG